VGRRGGQGIKKLPAVEVFRDAARFDTAQERYGGELTPEALGTGLFALAVPPVTPFSRETAMLVFGGEEKTPRVFMFHPTDAELAALNKVRPCPPARPLFTVS
jgi:hypothetical protein